MHVKFLRLLCIYHSLLNAFCVILHQNFETPTLDCFGDGFKIF